MKQLEDELGVQLLDRIGHRVKLTSAGEIVYKRGVAMLENGSEMLSELEEMRGLRRGTFRVGFPLLGSNTLFADIFADFRQRYPDIEIHMTEQGGKKLEELLLAGELELAASLLPVNEEDFEYQEVRCEPMDLLVSADHPLAVRDRVTFSDLRDSSFILYESGFALNQMITDACRQNGFTPAVAATSSQIDFIVGLVAAKLGIALLPRMIAAQRPNPATRQIKIDGPELFWHMSLIWRRGAYLSPAARAWLALTRERWGKKA